MSGILDNQNPRVCFGSISLAQLINPAAFNELVLAGITQAEVLLTQADQKLLAGDLEGAEGAWGDAFDALKETAIAIIRRRIQLGKNEGPEVRKRFRAVWLRMLIFGMKKKVVAKTVGSEMVTIS